METKLLCLFLISSLLMNSVVASEEKQCWVNRMWNAAKYGGGGAGSAGGASFVLSQNLDLQRLE